MSDSPWRRLREFFRRSERAEVDDEIAFHLEMRTRELLDAGIPGEQARAMAEERFGPVPPIENALVDSTRRRRQREERAEAFMNIRQDSSYAIRSLRKNPAFAAAAIATLALGVGATIAVFTVVNGVLIRPMPYADPSRIAVIWMTDTQDGATWTLPLSSGFYGDIERQSTQFEAIAAFRFWPQSLSMPGSTDVERVAGSRVSPALFQVLGVRPMAGQPFTKEQAVPGGPGVAMISHDLWQRKFGGDAQIIGKQIMFGGQPFTVTAVMPPGFSFPRGAELPRPFQFALRTDVWMPLVFDSTDLRNYDTQNLAVVGRLRPESTRLTAQSELAAIMRRFLDENAPQLQLSYQVRSLVEQAGGKVKRGLLILLGAVFCVLLIASANVASLLVARITNRERELAVRAALGAGRGRIARQLITENLLLAFVGAGIGVLIGFWGTKVMLALVPGSMPRADDIGIDWRVLSVALLIAIAGGVVFGLAASASVSWSRLAGTLHAGDTRSTGTRAHRYGRRFLVAAEVALSVMLLIGAALLTRTFVELQRVRPGFDARNVLTAGIGIPVAGRLDFAAHGASWSRKLNEIATRIGTAPGVAAVGAVSSLPLSGAFEGGGIRIVGEPAPPPGQGPSAQYSVVVGNYFAAAGIQVLAGRAFDASDDEPGRRGIIVNREFARKFFGSEANAVGREVRATFEFTSNAAPRTIVGVVDDVKQSALDDDPASQVYVPESQHTYPGLTFVVRTRGDPLAAVSVVKQAAAAVDPLAAPNDIRTMEDVVAQSMERQRFSMTLIGTFAVLALVLAIIGLYGVLALIVGQRRREIGVRLALGARPGDVVRMIVGEGARVAAVGIAIGVAGALGVTRVLGALLYGVSTTDAVTFAGASALVAVVALAAAYAPARRAARVDPKAALVAD